MAETEIESQTHSVDIEQHDNMILDTTMSETPSLGLTASPLPKTPDVSRPASQQPQSPTDSGSEYSDCQSNANSRPSSMKPQSTEQAFKDVSLEEKVEEVVNEKLDEVPAETCKGSRTTSIQSASHVITLQDVEKLPQSPDDSGSEYSESSSPVTSRHTSMNPSVKVEEIQIPDEEQAPVVPEKSPSRDLESTNQDAIKADTPVTVQVVPSIEPDKPTAATTATSTEANAPVSETTTPPQRPELAIDTSSEPKSNTQIDEQPSENETFTISVSPVPKSPDSNYSGSAPQSPKTPSVPISPMTPQQAHMSIDSMQSIALSESSLDYDHLSPERVEDVLATPRVSGIRHMRKPSSLEILQNTWGPPSRQSTLFDTTKDEPLDTPIVGPEDNGEDDDAFMDTTSAWASESSLVTPERDSGSSDGEIELDWFALDKTEEQEKEDRDLPEGAEDESTAFLLARLEQENAKFSADPKSATGGAMNKRLTRLRSKSRPPSMAHLKKLVSKDAPSIRYSLAPDVQQEVNLEEPPPMTELEFWAALVQDYPSTASRLPTLTTTKIRAGIPPPLRGVVWTSMAGARDKSLEEAFEKLQDEKSPYEGIINKDVGRSFPGVELFRDAEGEGQKMLGRVLKCFSLHDQDIGYCQGLGFLVGPLLMNMGEREAFCVLVRLMDHYALRPSFLPSLSGLHMRIFQFSTLLKQHHPELSDHLTELGVEPAYLSQWFLSLFAVTCPLPMLFRIYDVVFAEGANETVMRVALALFRRNEQKMMDFTEFEEVMQLLLGRSLWDVYACNADDLIDDFTSLGHIITHQRLAELEKEYESKDREAVGQSAGFLPDVQAAASRFLGRLWAPSHTHTTSKGASSTLSPQTAEKEPQTPGGSILSRPSSFLRRSPSKTSIGTINESSSSDSSASSGSDSVASTAPTESEVHDSEARESQADNMSMKSKAESMSTISMSASQPPLTGAPGSKEQQELHTQIEDLLMALSEMQRENAQMAAMLQKEREERNDDHRVVKKLVSRLGRGRPRSRGGKDVRRSMPPLIRTHALDDVSAADKRRTLPPRPRPEVKELPPSLEVKEPDEPEEAKDDDLEQLIGEVELRLDSNARFSASFETKAQLRSMLTRTREQLTTAETQVKDLSERAEAAETSLATYQGESESLRSEVEELRTRVNDEFKEKQKLELTIQNMEIQMRMEAKAVEKKQRTGWMSRAGSSGDVPTISTNHSRSRNGSTSSTLSSSGGLRELKLGRRDSVGSVQSIRSMKSQRQGSDHWPTSPPAVNISGSPPLGEVEITQPVPAIASAPLTPPPASPTQASAPAQASTHAASSSLSVPSPGGFARRTSSLATKEVFATPKHEPVPDEALLLELVNAKTAEAQARQEVDELKKSLQVQKRRAEEELLKIQAEAATAKLELEAAKAETEKAKEEAQAARAEVFDASPLPTPYTPSASLPATPAPLEEEPSDYTTPAKKPEPKKSETAPVSAGVGWFWSRRTASTTKATVDAEK